MYISILHDNILFKVFSATGSPRIKNVCSIGWDRSRISKITYPNGNTHFPNLGVTSQLCTQMIAYTDLVSLTVKSNNSEKSHHSSHDESPDDLHNKKL